MVGVVEVVVPPVEADAPAALEQDVDGVRAMGVGREVGRHGSGPVPILVWMALGME